MLGRTATLGFLSRGGAEVAALAATAIGAIIVIRAVGPAGAGDLSVTSTLFYLATVLTNGGLSTAAGQELAAAGGSAAVLARRTFVLRLGYATAMAILGESIVAIIPMSASLRGLLQLAILGVFINPVRHEWLLTSRAALGSLAAARVAAAAATVGVALLVTSAPESTLLRALFVLAPHLAAAFVTTGLAAVREFGRTNDLTEPPRPTLRAFALGGRHYLRADLAIFVYNNSDRLFVYVLGGQAIAGLYDAAYKLIQPFSGIASVVGDAFYLSLARTRGAELRAVLRRYVDLMFVATVPVGFGLLAFAGPIVERVYGDRFAAAAEILAVLGFVVTVGYLSGVLAIPFSAWRLPKAYGDSITAGSVANLIANVVLIPPLLGIGAAAATIIAKFVVAVAAVRPFREVTDFPVFRVFGAYCLISLVSVTAAWTVTSTLGLNPVLGGLGAAALYAVGVVVMMRRRRPASGAGE